MREKLITVLLVPVLVFPIVVIAAGGDLGLIWQEIKAFSAVPLVVAVYAQFPSATVGPSPPVIPTPGVGTAPAPLLTQWGYISASIMLALIALWSLTRGTSGSRSRRDG